MLTIEGDLTEEVNAGVRLVQQLQHCRELAGLHIGVRLTSLRFSGARPLHASGSAARRLLRPKIFSTGAECNGRDAVQVGRCTRRGSAGPANGRVSAATAS
jgi:hypothetical protein